MVSLNKPADRDHLSVQRFLESGYEDNGQKLRPLMEGDNEFIYRKEDLVTFRLGTESAWLDAFVERLLTMIHCKPVQVRLSAAEPPKIPTKTSKYRSMLFAPRYSAPVLVTRATRAHLVVLLLTQNDV